MFSLTHRPNLPPSSSPAPLCANNFADDYTIWNSPLVCRVRWETSGTLGMASHNVVLKTEIREDIVCALRCDDYILFNEFLRQNSRSLWMPFLLRFIVPVAVVQRAVVGLVILCLIHFQWIFRRSEWKHFRHSVIDTGVSSLRSTRQKRVLFHYLCNFNLKWCI